MVGLVDSTAIATRRAAVLLAAFALGACGPAPAPPPPTAPTPAPSPAPELVPAPVPAPVALPDMNLPPGPIYVCETGAAREPIALPANIESLCRRHPEMGPCQFERNACRARGGRVYTSGGEEVTAAVESHYDERVRRVRFQADAEPAKR
jgi:hypothetical protein